MKKRKPIWLIFWPIALIVYVLARVSDSFAEFVFARGIYKVYRTVIGFISGLLPFSLAEILVYLIIPFVLSMIILFTVRMIKHPEARRQRFLQGVLNSFIFVGILFFMFMFGCGANYYRYQYADLSGLTIEKSTKEELFELTVSLADRASAAREKLMDCEDEQGVFTLPYSLTELGKRAQTAVSSLGAKNEVLSGYYSAPKRVLWSRGMSELGITGIFFPFTIEANVNVDVAPMMIGSTMCHELSHMSGFMREDEANFLAYLACTDGDSDEVLNYSGLMLALLYTGNALYDTSKELFMEAQSHYSDAIDRDFSAHNRYWDQFKDTTASEIGEAMNDTYLKANNQTDGTRSYGRMVDLLLAQFKSTRSPIGQ